MASGTTIKPIAQATMRFAPTSFDDFVRLADILFKGGGASIPNIDRPEKMFTLLMYGAEVGLSPAQSMASVMFQGGRCGLYGDGLLAVVRASGLLEAIDEGVTGHPHSPDWTGWCRVTRAGEQPRTFTFTYGQAEQAGLIARAKGKDGAKGAGPWVTYPERMLVMRARGFALRDVFPDAVRGLVQAEELLDMEPEVRVVTTAALPGPGPGASGGAVASNGPAAGPTPPAAGPTPPAAAPPALPPVATGGITEEQLREVVRLRQLALASLPAGTTEADQAAKWAGIVAGYGVKSAREFTKEQAAAFLTTEGPKHDPFTYPPVPSAQPPGTGPTPSGDSSNATAPPSSGSGGSPSSDTPQPGSSTAQGAPIS